MFFLDIANSSEIMPNFRKNIKKLYFSSHFLFVGMIFFIKLKVFCIYDKNKKRSLEKD